MHHDKLEELKKALKSKKDIEEKKAQSPEPGNQEELEQLQKINGELEAKVSELEKELEQSKGQPQDSKESNEKYVRLYAEFENFKKRVQKEKQELIHFAQEEVLKDFLQILDDLERGLSHAEKSKELEILLQGVKLVEKNMLSLFEKFGLTPLQTVGQPFNPHFHEAMSHQESTEHPADTVAAEFRKGYLLKGKLVRPALVAVAKPPSSGSKSSS